MRLQAFEAIFTRIATTEAALAQMTREREAAAQHGWDQAVDWLRQRADSHAGRWMTMQPKEALKATAHEMSDIRALPLPDAPEPEDKT